MGTASTVPERTDNPAAREYVTAKVSRNVVTSITAQVGYMATRVLIPPFVLSHIGLEAYGLWATAFILVGFVGITTMGFSNVYIKNVASYEARKEYDKANQLISSGIMATFPVAIALFILFAWQWPNIAPMINIPPALMSEAKEVMLVVVGVFLASISFSVFTDVLRGAQLIAEAQKIWIFCYIMETIAIFALVGAGRGLRGLAEAFLFRSVLGTVLCAVYATRRLKWIRFSPTLFSRKAVRELVQFGGIFQIQGLLSTGLASAERLAALFFVGVEAAGLLDLARKWPNSISSIPMAFFGAFLPAASHLKANSNDSQGRADVRSLYLRGARYVNLCSSFFCGFLAVWPAAIIFVWLHEPLEHAALLMGMFAVTTQVHLLTGPGTSILRGAGHVYEEFSYLLPNVAALAIFVPLSRLVFQEWSALGVSTGVCVATVISALIFIHRAHRVLGVSLGHFLRSVVWPGTIPYMVALVMVLPLTTIVMQQGRWVGVGVLAIAGAAYGVVLVTILLRSILDQEEKRYLMRLSLKLTSPSLQRLAAWAIAPLSVRAEEA